MIWPETAAPFYFLEEKQYTPILLQAISAIPSDFLIGSPAAEMQADTLVFRNRAYLVTPDARVLGFYDKAHLVPFGEYVPLKRWLPFVKKIVAEVGNFGPGPPGKTLPWRGHRIGVQICYEMIFPELPRLQVQNGANCLINITNDAWYGTSSAPYQLFSMAVLRAVENRRTVIRAANTGISGFIDPCGRIIGETPLFKSATLTHRVPMLTVMSPYERWGHEFPLFCLAVTLTLLVAETAIRARERSRARASNRP
jgi:apolipoprotein N-acyltransferase